MLCLHVIHLTFLYICARGRTQFSNFVRFEYFTPPPHPVSGPTKIHHSKLGESERRPFVAPAPLTIDSPAYQARAWEMWEPRGSFRFEQAGGIGNARVKDVGNSYVVLFDYGSVVFLHFTQEQQQVGGLGGKGARGTR